MPITCTAQFEPIPLEHDPKRCCNSVQVGAEEQMTINVARSCDGLQYQTTQVEAVRLPPYSPYQAPLTEE